MSYRVQFFGLNTWHEYGDANPKARALSDRGRAFLYLEHCYKDLGFDCPVRLIDSGGHVWKVLGYFKFTYKRKHEDERWKK